MSLRNISKGKEYSFEVIQSDGIGTFHIHGRVEKVRRANGEQAHLDLRLYSKYKGRLPMVEEGVVRLDLGKVVSYHPLDS